MSSKATELVEAVEEELSKRGEYQTRQVRRDNDVAMWLAAQTSMRELVLFYRAQLRRGYVDRDQQHDIERHIERLQRTIGAQVETVRVREVK